MRKFFLTALVVIAATAAHAHSWYDYDCCSDRDCEPVPFHSVSITEEGVHVKLEPGEHSLVLEGVDELLLWGDVNIRQSQDGEHHACVAPALTDFEDGRQVGDRLLCVYIAAMS